MRYKVCRYFDCHPDRSMDEIYQTKEEALQAASILKRNNVRYKITYEVMEEYAPGKWRKS
jgi:hypothetical protein